MAELTFPVTLNSSARSLLLLFLGINLFFIEQNPQKNITTHPFMIRT